MKNFITFFLVLNSILLSQWTPVNLFPWQGSIYDFYMKDSLNITAVFLERYEVDGDSSAVIKSSDGGRSWSFSHRTPLTFIREAKIIDENNIFVSSTSTDVRSMKKTTDGGVTWLNISLPTRYNMLKCIQFLNPDIAFAVANYGTAASGVGRLLKTTDGGMNWAETDSVDRVIHGVKFTNSNHGWVMGSQLLETTDGGRTFTQVSLPATFENVASFDILNDSIISIGGYRIIFYPPYTYDLVIQMAFSTNRGQSWNFRDFYQQSWIGSPEKMIILDENTAIAHVKWNYGTIYTTDRGVTWNRVDTREQKYYFNDLKLFDNRLYLAGSGISFLASGNSITEPWELRIDQSYKWPQCASFSESGLVVIGAKENRIYVSTDRGNNWDIKLSQIAYPEASFVVNDSLIYMTDLTKIYRSVDKCNSFDSVAFFPSGIIKDIKVTKDGTIWIVSRDKVLVSNDNGATWTTKLQVQNAFFDKISLFEDGTYYAMESYLYKSTDYGNTWVKLTMPFQYLNQIEFYNSKNGFVRGSSHEFYRTTDGGISFHFQDFSNILSPFQIICQDSINFHITGTNLYSSHDGGISWQLNEFYPAPPPYPFNRIHMFDQFEGIGITSYYEGIWITKNRGNTPVELSTFSAIPLGNKVVLQWTTATETNNMGFEIERKFKNGSWEKIGTVKGNGTVTQKIYYSFDDLTLTGEGTYYYRLKQIDYNGTFEYSKEVEVIFGEVPEEYAIQQNYPNPFNPSTKINFSLPEENRVVIRVFNPMGELVQEINRGTLSHGYFEQDIEMGSNPSGMYFCQVLCTNTKTERTKSLTIKMVLMR